MKMLNFVFLTLAIVFSGTSVFATDFKNKGYDLKMELSMNGKIISVPQINTQAGETTTYIDKSDDKSGSEEKFIEVTAIDASILGTDGIMMTFVVGTIGKDGTRTVLSKPQIFTQENIPSEITSEIIPEITAGHVGKKNSLSLSVIATRKLL